MLRKEQARRAKAAATAVVATAASSSSSSASATSVGAPSSSSASGAPGVLGDGVTSPDDDMGDPDNDSLLYAVLTGAPGQDPVGSSDAEDGSGTGSATAQGRRTGANVPLADLAAVVLDPVLSQQGQLAVHVTDSSRLWPDVWFTSAVDAAMVELGAEAPANPTRHNAHQFLLAARSRYFRSLFKGSAGERGRAGEKERECACFV